MHLTDIVWTRLRGLSRVSAVILCASMATACAADPVPSPPAPDVWAVVDGREIRKDDVERAYRHVAPLSPVPSEDEALAAKLRILNDLLDQDILLQRARALKVEVTDAELEKAFAERKSNMPEEAFQKELAQRGLTPDDMKRALGRELTVQKLLQQEVGSKVSISDQTIREFYDQNRAQFNVAEIRYRIAQIVVTPVRDSQIRNRTNDDAATPAEAQRKAQMLMERLKGGADFAALAMDYSEDPQSAPQGGDLGFVPVSGLDRVAPELRKAVLNANPGSVTAVSGGGAHTLVLVVAREAAGQRDLGTPGVKEGITDLLRGRREQLLSAAYIAAARNDVKVVNYLARQLVEARGPMPGLTPSAPGRK
jgi:peptidyl-prolyl cis-trans isomerase SurA